MDKVIKDRLEVEYEVLSAMMIGENGSKIISMYPSIGKAFTGHNKEAYDLIVSDIEQNFMPPRSGVMDNMPALFKKLISEGYLDICSVWETRVKQLIGYYLRDRRRETIQKITDKELSGEDYAEELHDLEGLRINKIESNWVDSSRMMDEFIDSLGKERICYTTGIDYIDRNSPIARNDFVVLGGRPSSGKTSLSSQMMLRLAACQRRCAYFSLDDPRELLNQRLICKMSRVSIGSIRNNLYNEDEEKRMRDNSIIFRELPITVFGDTTTDLDELSANVARLKADKPDLEVVFLDHITKVRAKGRDKRNEVMRITDELQQWCRKFDITVIAISQLNRESDKDARALRMSDFRESGSIEEDATMMFGLYLDNEAKGIRESTFEDAKRSGSFIPLVYDVNIQTLKNKNGMVGSGKIKFNASYFTFEDC